MGLGRQRVREPRQRDDDQKFVAGGRDHSLAIEMNGTVWAWGWNHYGQVGDGTKANRLVPVRVPGLTGAVQVAAGANHSLARLSDGTAWAWGQNSRLARSLSRRTP